MSQFNKAAIINLLTGPKDSKIEEADAAAKAFIEAKRARALEAKPLIDTLEAQFAQIIRELRKGTTKEAKRRIVEYKPGNAKSQVEEIFALINPTAMPGHVARLRSEANVIAGVISVLEAVEGDTLDLMDLIRTGAFRLLPTQDPDAV